MAGRIRVEVLWAWPRRHVAKTLELAEGATVADAIAAAEPPAEFDASRGVAVFGEIVEATQLLRNGDRIELLRPLLIDPKEARRRRARKPARE